MSWKEQFHTAINGLRGWVLVADPADKEVIVGIGSSMEGAFKMVADDAADIKEMGQLCLTTLMGVYNQSLHDIPGGMTAISEALFAAMKQLSGRGDEVAAACEMLKAFNEGGPAPAPSGGQLDPSLAEATEQADQAPVQLEDEEQPAQAEEQLAAEQAEAAEAPAGQETQSAECRPEAGEPAQTPETVEAAAPAEAPEEPAPAPAAAAPAPAAKKDGDAPQFEGLATLPEDADLELLGEFIVECLDHITAAEEALLELESNPGDSDQINVVFRAFHTIKGTSGFLGLDRIQRTAHLAENMLDRGRDGEIQITGGYADLALKSCDALRSMIEGLQGAEPGGPIPSPENLNELLAFLFDPEGNGFSEEAATEPIKLGEILVGKGAADRDTVEQVASEDNDSGKKIGQRLVEKKAAKAEDVAKAVRTQRAASGGGVQTEATIRVGTDRLDSLINMVGELVIAQSMVTQDPDVMDGSRPRLQRNVSHAGKIIRELQDLTMSLRMVPLKGTFQKMARLVRDLGKKAGKQVQFVSEGDDTEIDRNMVEVLNDPLVHMIRNSCDHGIESAADRVQAGKEPTGTVKLRAYHSAGNVVIEIIDDGKGLDRDRILAKAREKGVIDGSKELTDSEVFSLIFAPGFSTAEKITDVSGRGVGMDVVKKNIESIRGRIEVSSKLGEGTTFAMRLPLTMAITDAMLLRVGTERYLLPTVSIEQSFRPEPGAISTVTNRGEMVMLRGELLPVFRLHQMFDVTDGVTDPYEGLLIAVESEGKRCALMVDELLGQQQVVIKTLGRTLKNIPGVAGGAILGDGRVGLILDASGLLQLAHGEIEMSELAMA
ncbi:MAG: chemotaxis protein CheA [Phycisphaerae bacterium]